MTLLSSSPQLRRAAQNEIRRALAPRYNPRHVPLETVLHTELVRGQATPSSYPECPGCRKAFSPGAVVTDPPAYEIQWRSYTTHQRLYCDGCRDLHIVHVTCNQDGTRINDIIGESGTIHGSTRDGERIIERFLREHPEARGVSDVVQ